MLSIFKVLYNIAMQRVVYSPKPEARILSSYSLPPSLTLVQKNIHSLTYIYTCLLMQTSLNFFPFHFLFHYLIKVFILSSKDNFYLSAKSVYSSFL
jgi:hypothetical protein